MKHGANAKGTVREEPRTSRAFEMRERSRPAGPIEINFQIPRLNSAIRNYEPAGFVALQAPEVPVTTLVQVTEPKVKLQVSMSV